MTFASFLVEEQTGALVLIAQLNKWSSDPLQLKPVNTVRAELSEYGVVDIAMEPANAILTYINNIHYAVIP